MVARFLVTTALEETWPADDVPVLFLGEWCRLYGRKGSWEKRDAVVAPYHWDDRQRLYQDYLHMQTLYEVLLQELANQLNEIHHVDHSVRYWRIIVGPWLGYFIEMLFDRWMMLKSVVQDNEISGVRVLGHSSIQFIPNDMAEFISMFVGDAWNEWIYGKVLNWMDAPVDRIDSISSENSTSGRAHSTIPAGRRLKRRLTRLAGHIFGALCREDEYFFISSYLDIKQHLLLQAKIGQFPKFWWPVAVPTSSHDLAARQWQLPRPDNNDGFSLLVRELIASQIPIAYLEGYRELVTLTENLPWPKNPRAIFTCESFNADDVFKVWAAEMVESGAPLVIGQHGGNYGVALWNSNEAHQLAIADRFLTWGWTEPEKNNITPVGNFKGFGGQCVADNSGNALLVEMTMPRHSYTMYSAPVAAGQWLNYFEDQCRFVQALPEVLRDQLLVRLYAQDYGLCQRQRWQSHFPKINLDDGSQPMTSLLKKARIFISTYNATTYLESLSLNFPSIIFWNPIHWELRDSAQPYFEKLKSAGILHETPESAALQMAVVWNDVAGWWHSAEVQSVRQEFCERYANFPQKPLDTLAKVFRRITVKTGKGLEEFC